MKKTQKSVANVKGWTEVRRHPMPMGDVLYTIQETPENMISDCIETHIETIMVDGGTPISVDSSFHNSASACSSIANLSDTFPSDFGHEVPPSDRKLLIPGGDFEMVPHMVDEWSKESLVYWKSRLELMEEQKKHIRQWMAETTMKITMSIKKMKDVAEKLHADLSRDVAPISECESTEADCMKTAEDEDTASYTDPVSLKAEDDSPTINDPIEELPAEIGEQTLDADDEEEDKLAAANGYLDFKEFATSPIAAEQIMVHTIKPHVLRVMELIRDNDWEKIKKLYIVLKRVGRVDRLLVYELSKEVLKTGMVDQDKMDGFLSSIDLEPAEALFQFGRALLILYHASLLLAGEEASVDNHNLDLFPELRKRRRKTNNDAAVDSKKSSICPRLCRQALKNSTAERILKKQGEKLTEMFYTNPPGFKPTPHQSNPAYAHVKSRYMEGLKKRLEPGTSTRTRANQMQVESGSNIGKKPACQRPKVKMLTGYEKSKIVISNMRNINKEEWVEVDHNKSKLSITEAPGQSTTVVQEEITKNVSQTPNSATSTSSSASVAGDRHSTSTIVEKEAIVKSKSKAELFTKTVDIPRMLAPTNSMESMSVASASIGDQSTLTTGKQYATDFFAYEVFTTNLSSGDFNKHSSTVVDDIKVLKSQTARRANMKVGFMNRKPTWKLVNKSNSEPATYYMRDASLYDKSEPTLATVVSNRK
uniref:tRNA modification GTPase MnmE n=1 Tax=Lygus hesperus TaxID=30085 RepID=A0A0A9XS55_LYGHE